MRVMDRFDNTFLVECCVRADSRITLSSLIDGKSYSGAWGRQGGMNRIGWRYRLTGVRSAATSGRFCGDERRCVATRRHTWGTDVGVQTAYLEKTGCFTVNISNNCRVFQCTVNWARARPETTLIAVGAAGSSPVFSEGERSAHATELAIELGVTENQRGRTTMRTVVSIVNQVPLFKQAVDFFLRQSLSRFDGGFAGHHRNQFIQQITARRLFRVVEIVGDVADQLFQIDLLEHHGITGDQQRVAPKFFNAEPEAVEHVSVVQQKGRLFGAHFEGQRNQQFLCFHRLREDPFAEVLVHDAFVQGVLIDDGQRAFDLDHDVTVQNLNRSQVGCRDVGEFVGRPLDFRNDQVGGFGRLNGSLLPVLLEVRQRNRIGGGKGGGEIRGGGNRPGSRTDFEIREIIVNLVELFLGPAGQFELGLFLFGSEWRRWCGNIEVGFFAERHLRLQIHAEKLTAECGEQLAIQVLPVAETDFGFRGMYVDVDQGRGHVEVQERDRLPPDHEQTAIGFGQRMLQRAVLNPAAVEEQVLPFAGRLVFAGMRDVAPDADVVDFGFDPDQLVGEFAAIKQAEPIEQIVRGGQIEDDFVVVPEHHVESRMREGSPGELLADVTELGLGGFQKLPPHGSVGEQLPDFNGSSQRTATGLRFAGGSGVDFEFEPLGLLGGTRADAEAADFGNRSERFAAKAHRLHAEQVVGGCDFTGRIAGDREEQVVGMNAFAVIDHADEVGTAIHDVDFDTGGEGVDTVIEEFLDRAGGAFDHFASGNFIDDAGIELMNAGNGFHDGFPFHWLISPTDESSNVCDLFLTVPGKNRKKERSRGVTVLNTYHNQLRRLTAPALMDFVPDSQMIADAGRHEVDQIVDGDRVMIKAGRCRHDDGAGLGEFDHVLQRNEPERRFAGEQNQFAAFFEMHVRSAVNEIATGAGSDAAQGSHRTGTDHHAIGQKRTTGDAGGEVFVVMIDQRPLFELGIAEDGTEGEVFTVCRSEFADDAVIGLTGRIGEEFAGIEVFQVDFQAEFMPENMRGRFTHGEMHGAAGGHQDFDQADSIDGAAGAGHGDDYIGHEETSQSFIERYFETAGFTPVYRVAMPNVSGYQRVPSSPHSSIRSAKAFP